jgi:hypothetical protein
VAAVIGTAAGLLLTLLALLCLGGLPVLSGFPVFLGGLGGTRLLLFLGSRLLSRSFGGNFDRCNFSGRSS